MSGIDSISGVTGGPKSYPSPGMGEAPKVPVQQERVVTVLEKQRVSDDVFPRTKVSDKQLEDAVGQANKEMEKLGTNLRFSIHEKTRNILVKIVNSQTNEVLREIPSEKILDMCAYMMEKAGLLVDKRG